MFSSLHFAARSLLRSPGFAFLAIITLGLGIGANTAMFSIVNTVLLKPLPYPKSEQLQRLDRVTPQNSQGRVSAADYLDLRREMPVYGDIGAYALGDTSLSEPGQPAEVVRALRITSNLLSVLGVQPQLGRNFFPREDVAGSDHVVILSQRCWQQRFGSARDIIGRTIRLDGQPHEIVGVLPGWFNEWRHLGAFDFFRPLALDHQKASDRRTTFLRLLGRRHDGLAEADATGFIVNFGARLAKDFPEVNAGAVWHPVALNGTAFPKNAIALLALLIGLSAFVLLIACSNLANLLLARTMARAREFAVRGALGASRFQLLRPLINESLLLAIAGGVCSLLVARWAADWLSLRTVSENGERFNFAFDWRVFGWAFVASAITAIAFGLAPALFALRLNVNDTLKSGARGTTGGRGHRRFRHALIVGQFALAMVLLAGAAMYARAFDELSNSRGGWESSRVVTGTLVLSSSSYAEPEKINAFHRLTLERLQALPGVASVSISSSKPFFNWQDVRKYIVEGRDLPPPRQEPAAIVNTIPQAYFNTYQTPVLAGRAFTERDTLPPTKVFIISQTTATALFGNENPIGRRL